METPIRRPEFLFSINFKLVYFCTRVKNLALFLLFTFIRLGATVFILSFHLLTVIWYRDSKKTVTKYAIVYRNYKLIFDIGYFTRFFFQKRLTDNDERLKLRLVNYSVWIRDDDDRRWRGNWCERRRFASELFIIDHDSRRLWANQSFRFSRKDSIVEGL